MGASEKKLKSLSSGRSWEGEKYKDQGKFSLVTSKLMPQPDSTSEHGIKTDATPQKLSFLHSRLRNGANYLIGSSRGSDSEPNFIRKLLSFPYRNLRASKTTFFLKNFCVAFSPVLFGLPEDFPRFLPPPPYRNIESRKTTRFFRFFRKNFCVAFSPMVLRLLEVSPSFLLPLSYSNMEGRKTTRFLKNLPTI